MSDSKTHALERVGRDLSSSEILWKDRTGNDPATDFSIGSYLFEPPPTCQALCFMRQFHFGQSNE